MNREQTYIDAWAEAMRRCIYAGEPIPAELRPPSGHCIMCHKPLRDPYSLTMGIGPDCLAALRQRRA